MRRYALTLLAALAVLAGIWTIDPFRDYQIATAAGYLSAAAGLTVLIGQSGQLSLGHGALMAIAAYTVALVQNAFGAHNVSTQWTLVVSLAAGVAVATVSGAVIGVAAARLRGPYLAGLTLVVAVAVPSVGTLAGGVFHGDQGLPVFLPGAPAWLGADFPYERWQAVLALATALLTMVVLVAATGGGFGRAMRAVRDDEVAAALAGVHVARVRVLAFVLSAACAGLGGGVFAVLAQSVSPSAFSLTLSLNLLLAIVVGGLGSLAGAVWGSVLLVLLPWLTDSLARAVSLSPGAQTRLAGNLPLAIFGLLLIIVMIAAPSGVQGLLHRAGRWARGVPRRLARRVDPSSQDASNKDAADQDAATHGAEPDAPLASRS